MLSYKLLCNIWMDPNSLWCCQRSKFRNSGWRFKKRYFSPKFCRLLQWTTRRHRFRFFFGYWSCSYCWSWKCGHRCRQVSWTNKFWIFMNPFFTIFFFSFATYGMGTSINDIRFFFRLLEILTLKDYVKKSGLWNSNLSISLVLLLNQYQLARFFQ